MHILLVLLNPTYLIWSRYLQLWQYRSIPAHATDRVSGGGPLQPFIADAEKICLSTGVACSGAQGVVTPATIVTAFAAALSPVYNWLLVDYFQIGLAGAALANDAVQVGTWISIQ